MASLSELEEALKGYQTKKTEAEENKEKAEDERDKAEKRMKAVKKLSNTLKSDFDNNVKSVNGYADDISREIEDGIIGLSTPQKIDEEIQKDKEKVAEDDTNLSAAIECLDDEYSELDKYYDEQVEKVKKYKKEISDANWNILNTQNAIIAEKARLAAEEAARKLEEARLAAEKAAKEKLEELFN